MSKKSKTKGNNSDSNNNPGKHKTKGLSAEKHKENRDLAKRRKRVNRGHSRRQADDTLLGGITQDRREQRQEVQIEHLTPAFNYAVDLVTEHAAHTFAPGDKQRWSDSVLEMAIMQLKVWFFDETELEQHIHLTDKVTQQLREFYVLACMVTRASERFARHPHDWYNNDLVRKMARHVDHARAMREVARTAATEAAPEMEAVAS